MQTGCTNTDCHKCLPHRKNNVEMCEPLLLCVRAMGVRACVRVCVCVRVNVCTNVVESIFFSLKGSL